MDENGRGSQLRKANCSVAIRSIVSTVTRGQTVAFEVLQQGTDHLAKEMKKRSILDVADPTAFHVNWNLAPHDLPTK